MVALPPVQNVLKAVVNFNHNTIPCCNIFHIRYSGNTPNNSQAAQIASSVHSQWSQNFIPWLLPQLVLQNCIVQDLSSALGAQGEHVAQIPGAAAGDPLPASAAVVGSWSIANRYRGGKPRTYITGLQQSEMLDAQNWNGQTVQNFQNGFQGFMNNINALATPAGVGPFALGCVHYRLHLQPLVNPTFDPFTAVLVRPGIRSMRGRLT